MSSFEKINYNLRPNKCIERKMMCEALGRLSLIDKLSEYRYIGLGSPYFADFILLHKTLGITDLVSIEKEVAKKSRFEFNIPYSGIKVHYGHSETILPNLEMDIKKNIVWLDYDDKISSFMFSDTDSFFSNALPGSFFILSVNVEQDFLTADADNPVSESEFRMNKLFERVGKERVPNEYMTINLTTKKYSEVTYDMLNRQIISSIITRNGNSKEKVQYKQIFNFLYKDNATILTIGGILYDKGQKNLVEKMAFEELTFFSGDSESYKLESPSLTYREIKALDSALPDKLELNKKGEFTNTKLSSIPLSQADIKKYAKIYRYYPNYTESNL